MRRLVLRLRAGRSLVSATGDKERVAEEVGIAAFGSGASEADCPYRDEERSAAWSRGFRRADRLDASVW